jgi:hypothetical protein
MVAGDRAERVYRAAIRAGAALGETGRGLWHAADPEPSSSAWPLSCSRWPCSPARSCGVSRWWALAPAAATVGSIAALASQTMTTMTLRTKPVRDAAVTVARAALRAGQVQQERLRTATDVATAEWPRWSGKCRT